MSDNSAEFTADLWAWLHDSPESTAQGSADHPVTAFILTMRGGRWSQRCRDAVAGGEFAPAAVHVVDQPPGPEVDAAWLWFVPDTCEPAPRALAELVSRAQTQPEIGVVGSLLVEPPRRGPGTLVSEWATTVTGTGRLRPLVEPGELHQGQLDTRRALGVPTAGILVRGDVWRALGGFNRAIPAGLWGLDLGWRANLAGYVVVAEPRAQLIDRGADDDPAANRAAMLALVAAHAPRWRRWFGVPLLSVLSLLTALGYLLGKDPERAADELLGWWTWVTGGDLRRAVTARLAATEPTDPGRESTRSLLPKPGSGVQRAADGLAENVADWAATFTERGASPGLDELTGDDFAVQGRPSPRRSAFVVGGATVLILALVAGRNLFGPGALTGPLLLPAPDSWTDLLAGYTAAVPGTAGLAGPPWLGLSGLAALVTLGSPGVLVSLLVLGCVPLAWFAAFRLLRQLLDDPRVAALAATAYALAPALSGALNQGALGVAVWTVLLPAAGYSLSWWAAGPGRLGWRGAAAAALWLVLACALLPAGWLVALGAGLAFGLRERRSWPRLVLVLTAPLLLLVGPWAGTLARYPARLLTGIEPSLAPLTPSEPWTVLLAATGTPDTAPLWLSGIVVGVLWLAAVAGAARRPGLASVALGAAAGSALVAVVLTRLVLWVPPGTWSRPQAAEWLVLMVGALVLAAAVGLDGVGPELKGRSLGIRHLATLGLVVAVVAALILAGGWWAVWGQSQLVRREVGSLPAFVHNAQLSDTPGRTLALWGEAGAIAWSLIQDDFPRFGQVEGGLVFAGDPQATTRTASVVSRLAAGSGDDQLLPDLVSLGVSHIWLSGGEADLRIAIGNVPGLGAGTGDSEAMVWGVPDSGRFVVVSERGREVVGPLAVVPAGPADRRLILAEPADPRWQATLDGVELPRVTLADGRQAFELDAAGGSLEVLFVDTSPWWAWVQLAGLAALVVLAAPGLKRRSEPVASRRVQEAAPRRAEAGGQR